MQLARNIAMFAGNSNAEEEMYKEMFLAVMGGVPQGQTVRLYDPDITFIGGSALSQRAWLTNSTPNNTGFEIDFPNVTQCGVGEVGSCFNRCGLKSVNLPKLQRSYGAHQFAYNYCTEIDLPLLQNWNNHDFSYSPTLKTLRLPSATRKSGDFFVYNCSALENVYLDSMSCETLGVSYVTQQNCSKAAVFHCSDGNIVYNSTSGAWEVTT